MRIRKRQAPLPLPDPLPIDPSPMVQLPHAPSPKSSAPLIRQQPPRTTAPTASSLSVHPRPLPPMDKPEDAGDFSAIIAERGAYDHHAQLDRSDEAGGGLELDGGEKRNDTGKGFSLDSGTVSEVIPLSPSNLDGKWCEGEKAIPPKKRRVRGGDYIMNTRESNNGNNNKKMKTRMKTKMNKKCTQNEDESNGGEEEVEEEEEIKEEVNMDVNTSKRKGRASVVMEGSRCSRVNGRGWRCCQQTLVGYSLCEYHLGKGRLRSITSVRSRSIPSTITTATKDNNDSLSVYGDSSVCAASSSSPEKKSKYDSSGIHNDIDQHKDEKKPTVITKKRMKLGMVKARSISSLLGQTSTPPVTLPAEDNNK